MVARTPDSQYLSTQEVAAIFGVNPRTITRMIADGSLQAFKFGPKLVKIERTSVEALLVPIATGAAS